MLGSEGTGAVALELGDTVFLGDPPATARTAYGWVWLVLRAGNVDRQRAGRTAKSRR